MLKLHRPHPKRIALILCFLGFAPAHARWAKPEDMDFSIEFRKMDYVVHADGTYDETIDQEILILKDSARISQGMVRVSYNPGQSTFEIKLAETLSDSGGVTTRTPVPPEMIEDKPLASTAEGFDQWHQVLIAFPGVEVGTRVHVKYTTHVFNVMSPGNYSDFFSFGWDLQKEGRVTIRSEKPIFTRINDPDRVMSIVNRKVEKDPFPHRIEIKLLRSYLKNVVDEVDPFLDPVVLATVEVSTAQSWADLPAPLMAAYEGVVSAKLPAVFKKIADKARKISDPIDQINLVTSSLSDEIRYLGDWRTVNGQWVPRTLAEIASSKYGDCKDFSVAIAAILRELGLRAEVAWVYRSWAPDLLPYKLPSTLGFNHAITRAEKDGRVFWLDGTNVASFAQGVPGDISARPALIFDKNSPRLEKIPQESASTFGYQIHQHFDFTNPGAIDVEGDFRSFGGDSAGWINGNLNSSQESLNYKVIRAVTRADSVYAWKVRGFRIDDRVVHDVQATFRYKDRALGYRSTAGLLYPILTPDTSERFLVSPEHRESALILGEPFSYERTMEFSKLSIAGNESLSCDVDSPWVKIERHSEKTAAGLSIHDRLLLKVNRISATEIKTPEFAELQKQVTHCYLHSSIIYGNKKDLNE